MLGDAGFIPSTVWSYLELLGLINIIAESLGLGSPSTQRPRHGVGTPRQLAVVQARDLSHIGLSDTA